MKIFKKLISALVCIPFLFVVTLCCCLEENASAENVSNAAAQHHQRLEKSQHPEHQHSDDQDECSCPKHLSFLSQQPFDITPDLSSLQLLAKNALALPSFQIVLSSSSSIHAQGPPGQEHRDQVSIPIFLKNANLRI